MSMAMYYISFSWLQRSWYFPARLMELAWVGLGQCHHLMVIENKMISYLYRNTVINCLCRVSTTWPRVVHMYELLQSSSQPTHQ